MFGLRTQGLLVILVIVLFLVGGMLAPVVWGYQQRRQARAWQSVACAYRVREVAQRARLVYVDTGPDPCGMLHRLGFALEPPR